MLKFDRCIPKYKNIIMKKGDILTPERKHDLDKIHALKELALSIINMRILPLRSERDNLDESDATRKEAIEAELKIVEAEFVAKCKEMEKLCDKHGLRYQIITARYVNPPS